MKKKSARTKAWYLRVVPVIFLKFFLIQVNQYDRSFWLHNYLDLQSHFSVLKESNFPDSFQYSTPSFCLPFDIKYPPKQLLNSCNPEVT